MRLTCRALLLDMDGVLILSTPSVERSWRVWAARHGLDPEAVIHAAHGRPTQETIRAIAPQLDADAETRALDELEGADADGVEPVPGAARLLSALPAGSYAVVTSASRGLARIRFAQAGLDVPSVVVSADDVRRGKPDPDPYLTGAAKLGIESRDCIVIEDSPAGVAAGLAAGCRVIGLRTTYEDEALAGAEAVLSDLEGIAVRIDNGGDLTLDVQTA
jgi:mannitol-1-/sugar-/sorbitol-6-phosphatase